MFSMYDYHKNMFYLLMLEIKHQYYDTELLFIKKTFNFITQD